MAYDGWIITTPPSNVNNTTPINTTTLRQIASLLGVTDVTGIKDTQITKEELHQIADLLGIAKPTTSTTILIRSKG